MELNDEHIDNEIRKRVALMDDCYPDALPPPDQLWELILLKRKRRRSLKIRRAWSIAASVIFMVAVTSIWRMSKTEPDKKDNPLPYVSVTTQKNEAIEYINRLCSRNNISCTKSAFKELREELEASSIKLIEVNKQIAVFGNDAQLLRAKTRIENHQTRIIKAMVQML